MDVLARVFREAHGCRQSAVLPQPGRLARRLAALYRCWERRGRIDLVELAGGFLARLSQAQTPVGRTCLAAADAVARWGGHAYHSSLHHAEVATNAMVIAEIAASMGQALAAGQCGLLLAACLSHDLYYDPEAGAHPDFYDEAVSARALTAIAAGCEMTPQDQDILAGLVLATEPRFRACLRRILNGSNAPQDAPWLLAALVAKPEPAGLAAILSDADLLSSAGLTLRWHAVQIGRLERETGQRIWPEDDAAFFDDVVGPHFLSTGGRYFDPNLARMRAAVNHTAARPPRVTG